MRKIKLITNCDRAPNYLMDISVKHWLENGFRPEDLIFLVNNISDVDMVVELKKHYNIDAKRVDSIDNIYDENQCVVWDHLKEYDWGTMLCKEGDIANDIQHKLLKSGTDVVIFLDRDELLWHESNDLINILNKFTSPVIRPRGIEVIQNKNEKILDLSIPISEQRTWFRWYPSKSKPCIVQSPVHWIIGRHGTKCGKWPHADTLAHPELQFHPEADINEYPGLYLLHLDKIDIQRIYDLRVEGNTFYKTNNLHAGEVDIDKFYDWFYEAHLDTRAERELYQDTKFLKKVGI